MERIIKLYAGMTGEFEIIKTNATNEVIELQLEENGERWENGDNIEDPYDIIKSRGFKVICLGCQDDIYEDEICIDADFDYYDYI